MKTSKGFIAPLLLALIAILLIGSGAFVYVQNKQVKQSAVVSPVINTTQNSAIGVSNPLVNSITRGNDHDVVNVVLSGSNFIDRSVVEYLSNNKFIDSFCGYLNKNGTLTHSWGQPEGGWSYYSGINQLRVVNADCRTADIKSDISGYPSSTASIRMIGNFPTLK